VDGGQLHGRRPVPQSGDGAQAVADDDAADVRGGEGKPPAATAVAAASSWSALTAVRNSTS
jgi:hypothetical protein